MAWIVRGFGLLLALAMVVSVTIMMVGPERLWLSIAGSPDLGPLTLSALERSGRPNDALIAPRRAVVADIDEEAPIFALPPDALYERLTGAVSDLGTVDWMEQNPSAFYARGITRSRVMRFPDTNHIWVLPVGDTGSTVALYARAQLGYSDAGKNRQRLEEWIRLLGDVPRVEAASR